MRNVRCRCIKKKTGLKFSDLSRADRPGGHVPTDTASLPQIRIENRIVPWLGESPWLDYTTLQGSQDGPWSFFSVEGLLWYI